MSFDRFGSWLRETPDEPGPDPQTTEGLLELLDAQAALLIDVATGASPFDSVNPRYRRRRRLLNTALQTRGLAAPFPFEDFQAWHGHWKAHSLGKHRFRRDRIAELPRRSRDAPEAALAGAQVADPGTTAPPGCTNSTNASTASCGSSVPPAAATCCRVRRPHKTDTAGEGAYIGNHYASRPRLCAVLAVEAWRSRLATLTAPTRVS